MPDSRGCHKVLLYLQRNNCFAVQLWPIVVFGFQSQIPWNNSVQSFIIHTMKLFLPIALLSIFVINYRHCWSKLKTFPISILICFIWVTIIYLFLFWCLGGINRAGAAVPTFLRTPTVIQPHLDMKPFLQFPMETPPPPHSMSLFHNFNTVRDDAVAHTHSNTHTHFAAF